MIDTPEEKFRDYIEYQTFQPDDLIDLETDFYWLLQQGKVKCSTWTKEGHAIVLGYWGFNDLIGMPLSFINPYYAKCLTTVKAGRIPIEQAGKITRLIQRQVQQTEEILYILRSESTYSRLKQILIWLSQKFGQEVAMGKSIDLRLTHQDLAELVGATRVTVTKLINQLEQERFLTRPRRNNFVLLKAHPHIKYSSLNKKRS